MFYSIWERLFLRRNAWFRAAASQLHAVGGSRNSNNNPHLQGTHKSLLAQANQTKDIWLASWFAQMGYASWGPIFWPFLRSPARAPTIKPITGCDQRHFWQLKGPSIPVTGGFVPLMGPSVPNRPFFGSVCLCGYERGVLCPMSKWQLPCGESCHLICGTYNIAACCSKCTGMPLPLFLCISQQQDILMQYVRLGQQ